MAELVMGAVGSLIPKLRDLLEKEYKLQTRVKERISSLTQELEVAQATLGMVAQVPWDQLNEQVRLWARQVREASYDMEDVLDTFHVHIHDPNSAEQESLRKRLDEKLTKLWKKSMARRKISCDVKDIMSHLEEVTKRCHRYKIDNIVARSVTVSSVDPRLPAMYNKVKNLVGMDKSSSELISMLHSPQLDDTSNMRMKIVSIVGVGGLGKTTLAKMVYDMLKGDYDCTAFVPVGQNPDLKKVFKDILIHLDRQRYLQFSSIELDERNLIDELRFFLQNKRYFLIIDDIWEIESWKTIRLAIDDDHNRGSRIIITSRKLEVATKADEVYKLQPLPYDSSRKLFYTRISGEEGTYNDDQLDETSDKILSKCGGIPLAIITMASVLMGKPKEKWPELYKSIGFWCKENKEAENTMRILSFSYYELPSHLRTCLLYLSAFPEDYHIPKNSLIWMWIAEGFVKEKQETRLFEIGEGFFNDLINRSMIEAIESDYNDSIIIGCRVHDMVLDFIRSISREENFFTVLDSNEGTPLWSNVRRLGYHYRTMWHTRQGNRFDMQKARSFIALDCVTETILVQLSNFKFLRVLALEYCKLPNGGDSVQVGHLGHLVHLRFLSLRGMQIVKIPEELGALRFLKTLDLSGCNIEELSSCRNLPTQLVCLRISLSYGEIFTETGLAPHGEVASLERLTSLEELSICVNPLCLSRQWLVKELGTMRELRVLYARIFCDGETERDLVESIRHLHELRHLTITIHNFKSEFTMWQASELVLPCYLQHLVIHWITFWKLPSCINPSCLPNLSHLELWLQHVDDHDLKILGGLPELRFLGLKLYSSATMSNITDSDSDAGYFPKLRCCRLKISMVQFLANDKDNSVSFSMWRARVRQEISMPSISDEDESHISMPSVSGDELYETMPSVSGDEQYETMPSVSADELPIPLQPKHQHGRLEALAYYLLSFFQNVMAFFKKWSPITQVGKHHHPLISDDFSAPAPNEEDLINMPAVYASDDEKSGSVCSKGAGVAPPFMPNLQVLHFAVPSRALEDQHYCDNLGLEFLPSLKEISVVILKPEAAPRLNMDEVWAALRHVAEDHPNRPALRISVMVVSDIPGFQLVTNYERHGPPTLRLLIHEE